VRILSKLLNLTMMVLALSPLVLAITGSACWLYVEHGEPVATASLFLAAGVAGVYFVFTVEEARRQGIGTTITLAALREARGMGYETGVLGSSELGYSVYRRLGFEEHCRIGVYEWRPPTPGGG